MAIITASSLPGLNLFSSLPSTPPTNDPSIPTSSKHPPSPPIPIPKYPPPPPRKNSTKPPTNPALKTLHRRTKYFKPVKEGVIASDGDRSVLVGDSGVSYLLPGAPFEFQYSYSETPKVKPLAIREPAFLPFAPPTMPRPWTGKAPLKKKKDKKVRLFDSFNPPPPGKMGARQMEMPGPLPLGKYPKDRRTREEILGEPLKKWEIKMLIQPHLKNNRQVNLGRDGLTHNMLELIHSHWRGQRVCKVRCKGVPTVDMNNVCRHLEEKTGGKIIHRVGGVVYLFRGRNYNYRTRPQYPVMLWKPATPVYPKLRLIQAFFALHDRNTNGVLDAESIVGKGVDLALEQWWQLPEMSVHARIPLLQQFQQLVEVQESAKVLVDIANGNKLSGSSVVGVHGNLYADLKDILETWRLRTPNEWDNMCVWYDLLQWRNEMYNAVIDAFKDFSNTNSQLHHLGYRDKAWNVNRLAHIARKQGLYDVCVTILEKMYGHSTMEVQEAFVKIREQAKALLEMKGELTNGLNLINSTNLEYFPVKNKAEIFRLKGDFFLKLNDSENANLEYSNAITLFKNLPKGWISWGNYCDMAYKETNDEIWLEYAVSCFLQGIKFGVSNSRSHLARVLYLLSFDTPNEPVGKSFDKYYDQIPHWVWLSWIPQLLLSLQRTEAPHCKLVLLKIATVYPQALYYWLRTYLLERRDVANKSELNRALAQQRMQQGVSGTGAASLGLNDGNARGQGHGVSSANQVHQGSQSSGGIGSHDGGNSHGQEPEQSGVESSVHAGNDQALQQSTSTINEGSQNALRRSGALGLVASAASAFDAAKDIMEALRSKHTNLASELEVLLTEIGSRFVTLPEERLLAVVNALLHRCYKYPTATTAEVPQSLKKELSGVCRACFSADAVNKHVDFVREYKQEFERDLDPDSTTTFPATLSELTERLKHWKNVLQSNVEDRFPAVLKLEEESRVLRDFHVVDVEVPGQYFSDQEIAPDHTVKLDRIGADIPIVRRHGSSFRRLTLIGSDGSQRHFIVQTSLTPNARSDERILQLFRVMNQMFDKHKESRRRHICIHTPIIIPVWSQVRMVEDDLMYSTFLEVYENHCARNDREADLPITYFKEQLNQAISGQISPEAVVDLRLQAYTDITRTLVTDNIFSQYMYKTLLSGNHMWAFKKQFAIQLALSSFMSFMLQIGGRSPNKILFAKNTGKIFQNDFHPAYDSNGMIEFNEPVPFRLTRNMQAFFSHFGVEGLIVSAMCAAAQAVVSPKQSQHLWHQLAMFFRDELLSWSWRRPLGIPLAPIAGGSSTNPIEFKQKVTTNVEHVIRRINEISPQYFCEEEENTVDPPQSVQRGVTELVEAALTPRNLCMMDPTWHPWF